MSILKPLFKDVPNILQIDEFEEGWRSIYERSGLHDRSIRNLEQKCRHLNGILEDDILKCGFIETIQGYPGLFSLKVSGYSMNTRIMCCLVRIDNIKRLVLLHIFKEKNKSSSKTDSYDKACDIAESRKERLEVLISKQSKTRS